MTMVVEWAIIAFDSVIPYNSRLLCSLMHCGCQGLSDRQVVLQNIVLNKFSYE